MERLHLMTSIPNKIKIGAWNIELKLQEDLSNKSGDEGCYYEADKLIVLDKAVINCSDRYAATLVWHEVCHAIHSQYQIDSESGEEKTVGAYSQGIVQVCGDNPEFTKWMVKCLK